VCEGEWDRSEQFIQQRGERGLIKIMLNCFHLIAENILGSYAGLVFLTIFSEFKLLIFRQYNFLIRFSLLLHGLEILLYKKGNTYNRNIVS
jgi:hypothetical protein